MCGGLVARCMSLSCVGMGANPKKHFAEYMIYRTYMVVLGETKPGILQHTESCIISGSGRGRVSLGGGRLTLGGRTLSRSYFQSGLKGRRVNLTPETLEWGLVILRLPTWPTVSTYLCHRKVHTACLS